MSKKRDRRIAARDKKEARKMVTIVLVSTAILLVLLYFVFQGS